MQRLKKISFVLIVISIFNSNSLLSFAEDSLKHEKIVQDNLSDAKSYYNLGLSYYAEGNIQKAIYNLQKAKEMYMLQGNYQRVLEIENYLNSLSFKEAFEEVNRRIDDLVENVNNLKSREAILSSKIDNIINTLKEKDIVFNDGRSKNDDF